MSAGDIDLSDLSELDVAEILARLYNEARPIGLGVVQDVERGGVPMDLTEAIYLLKRQRRSIGDEDASAFDYVYGRPLKVRFIYEGDRVVRLRGAWVYDRDQGAGHCQRVVDSVRAGTAS